MRGFSMRGCLAIRPCLLHNLLMHKRANQALATLALLGMVLLLTRTAPAEQAEGSPPNIVLILADDMGYSDIGPFGGEIETPSLDALAENGLRFSQFYNGARCCPTRAALMTGLYAHQAGVGHMTQSHGLPGYLGRLQPNAVTMAEVLAEAGYYTAAAGKWHLGPGPRNWPMSHGFDRYFGSPVGGVYYDSGNAIVDGEDIVVPKGGDMPDDFYGTDVWTDHAIGFIEEAHEARKPLFLYMAHVAPHFPLQASEQDIARYRGKYVAGWDELRKARHQRQVEMGLIDPSWSMPERPEEIAAWESLGDEEKDRFDQIMAIYAAVVDRMDHNIGRLVEALRDRDMLENTIIIFISDNGGNAEAGPNGRLEGGEWPGGPGSLVWCGQSWAHLQNTPFRLYKHYTHEGGIASPMIVHWPAGLASGLGGKITHDPGHIIDLMATFVDLANAEYPQAFDGHDITPMEGTSLRPLFDGQTFERQEPLFWEHEGNRAVRQGHWKLVSQVPEIRRAGGEWELYDLSADRTETTDLADEHPEKVADLAAKWDEWADRANVKPWPWSEQGHAAQFSDKQRFELKAGDTLDQFEAPHVQDRPFRITADLAETGEGVIIAQGGKLLGYTLHIAGGKVHFSVRNKGKLSRLSLDAPAEGRPATIVARLMRNGRMLLRVEGGDRVRGESPGPIAMPIDGLSVGGDTGDPVGDYTDQQPFTGKIERVKIELMGQSGRP